MHTFYYWAYHSAVVHTVWQPFLRADRHWLGPVTVVRSMFSWTCHCIPYLFLTIVFHFHTVVIVLVEVINERETPRMRGWTFCLLYEKLISIREMKRRRQIPLTDRSTLCPYRRAACRKIAFPSRKWVVNNERHSFEQTFFFMPSFRRSTPFKTSTTWEVTASARFTWSCAMFIIDTIKTA